MSRQNRDLFKRRIVIGVEGIHTAERELDPSPRRLKATPRAAVCAANQDFNENGVFCDMLTLRVLSLSPRSRLKPHRTKRLVRNDECTEHGLELGMGV